MSPTTGTTGALVLSVSCALSGVGCSSDESAALTQEDAAATVDARRVDAGPSRLDAGSILDAALPTTYVQLIDNQSWRRYDAALDPLPSHEPAVIDCQDSATYLEYGSYEVDSTRCNYLLAEHPSLLTIPAGTQLRLNFLHYDLLAPEPAEAHVALLFGDALQWETFIPIPHVGDGMMTIFNSTKAIAKGEPIRLHLHNHGGNTYLLVALEAAD